MESTENKIVVNNSILFQYVEEQIKSGKSVTIRIKGRSMEPALYQYKDKVVLFHLHLTI